MNKKLFDGYMKDKPVKVIVKDKGNKGKHWMAKPKNRNLDTPHFKEFNGKLEVHQDSADGTLYRKMDNITTMGSTVVTTVTAEILKNSGLDIAILPMEETSDGFIVNTSASGAYVEFPKPNQQILFAQGKWGEWKEK